MKELLRKGYLEMLKESDQLMRDFKHLDRQSWKHAN